MKKINAGLPFPHRRIVPGFLLFCAVVLLLLCSAGVYSSIHPGETPPQIPPTDPSAAPAAAASPLYILREYDRRIGIFAGGDTAPSQILDVYIFTLPPADRTALQKGIPIWSDEELQARVEDFTG